MKRMRWDGSYTVEAAFVVPVILGIIFIIMYVTMVFHDKMLLQANLNKVLIQTANKDIAAKTYNYKMRLSENLWIMEVEEAEVTKEMLQYRAGVYAEATVSIPVLSYFMNGKQEAKIEETYGSLRPEIVKRRKGHGED